MNTYALTSTVGITMVSVSGIQSDLREIFTGIVKNNLTIKWDVTTTNNCGNDLTILGARVGRYPVQPCAVRDLTESMGIILKVRKRHV